MADADPATVPEATDKKKRGRPPKVKPPKAESPPESEGKDEGRPVPDHASGPVECPPPADTRRMATRLTAGALRAALKDVLGAIHSRSEIPILSHVLLRADGASLALTGTDLDQWVTRTLAAEPESDWRGFTVALPAKPLDKLLGELEAETQVTLEREAEATRLTIRAGRSRFVLHCLPPDDFPLPPPFTGKAAFDIACGALDDTLASVRHAISTEETRYYLNGVCVHVHPADDPLQLRLATTDGNRLARAAIALPDGAASFPQLIWPRSTVGLLDKLLPAAAKTGSENDPAMVLVEANGDADGALLRFDMPAADGGEVTVVAKSIDGTFPDYVRVIPSDPGGFATIDKAALAAGVRRVSAIASEKTRAVRCTFTADKLTLTVASPELGEAAEEVPCMYDGPEASLGFNADYLLQALGAFASDDVTLGFDDPIAPVLVTAFGRDADEPAERDRLVQVLMPMRVG